MCFLFLSSLGDFDFHFSFNICFINVLHMTHDIYIIITQMVVKAPKSIYSIHSFQASRKVYLVHLMSKVYPYSNYLCLRLAITLNKDKMIGLFFFFKTLLVYTCACDLKEMPLVYLLSLELSMVLVYRIYLVNVY